MKKMNYRRRTVFLIAVWILLYLFVSAATFQRSGIRLAVNRSLIEADGEDRDQDTAENEESRTSE